MKVLLVINSLNMGGAEQLVAQLMLAYQDRGVDAHLLVLGSSNTPISSDLRSQGLRPEFLEAGSLYSPINILKLRKRLVGYELIHVHLFPALYWVALAKAWGRIQVPLVFTEHSTYNKRRGNALAKRIDRWIYRKYAYVICITEEVEQNLKEHWGGSGPKTSVIPNGISIERFSQALAADRSDFGLHDTDRVLIQVSSFRDAKDQPTLIKALTTLPEVYRLLLVGTGPTEASCRELVEKLGLASRVQFLGVRTDIPQLLKMSDYVVLSTHYEGMSLACIEGMASGRPFLASRVPGVIDLVEGHGLLFTHKDPSDLAQQLLEIEKGSAEYPQVVQRCQSRAAQFDIRHTAQEHINLYRSLCNERS